MLPTAPPAEVQVVHGAKPTTSPVSWSGCRQERSDVTACAAAADCQHCMNARKALPGVVCGDPRLASHTAGRHLGLNNFDFPQELTGLSSMSIVSLIPPS